MEYGCDLAKTIARNGSRAVEARNASQRCFDWKSDLLFDFLRRKSGCRRVDLYLHIGDVGHGINGQVLE